MSFSSWVFSNQLNKILNRIVEENGSLATATQDTEHLLTHGVTPISYHSQQDGIMVTSHNFENRPPRTVDKSRREVPSTISQMKIDTHSPHNRLILKPFKHESKKKFHFKSEPTAAVESPSVPSSDQPMITFESLQLPPLKTEFKFKKVLDAPSTETKMEFQKYEPATVSAVKTEDIKSDIVPNPFSFGGGGGGGSGEFKKFEPSAFTAVKTEEAKPDMVHNPFFSFGGGGGGSTTESVPNQHSRLKLKPLDQLSKNGEYTSSSQLDNLNEKYKFLGGDANPYQYKTESSKMDTSEPLEQRNANDKEVILCGMGDGGADSCERVSLANVTTWTVVGDMILEFVMPSWNNDRYNPIFEGETIKNCFVIVHALAAELSRDVLISEMKRFNETFRESPLPALIKHLRNLITSGNYGDESEFVRYFSGDMANMFLDKKRIQISILIGNLVNHALAKAVFSQTSLELSADAYMECKWYNPPIDFVLCDSLATETDIARFLFKSQYLAYNYLAPLNDGGKYEDSGMKTPLREGERETLLRWESLWFSCTLPVLLTNSYNEMETAVVVRAMGFDADTFNFPQKQFRVLSNKWTMSGNRNENEENLHRILTNLRCVPFYVWVLCMIVNTFEPAGQFDYEAHHDKEMLQFASHINSDTPSYFDKNTFEKYKSVILPLYDYAVKVLVGTERFSYRNLRYKMSMLAAFLIRDNSNGATLTRYDDFYNRAVYGRTAEPNGSENVKPIVDGKGPLVNFMTAKTLEATKNFLRSCHGNLKVSRVEFEKLPVPSVVKQASSKKMEFYRDNNEIHKYVRMG